MRLIFLLLLSTYQFGCSTSDLEVKVVSADELFVDIKNNNPSKIVLVNVWSTWCIPCIEEFPHIVDLGKDYKNEDLKVVFVSADWDENSQAVYDFLVSEGVTGIHYRKKEGADEGIIYERDMDRDLQKKFSDEIKELSGGGVDMIYDLVGGDYAEPALRAIARHGKYLVIGFTAGIPKMPLNLTLLKECQIVGVFWGQFAAVDHAENAQNFKELFELHAQGKIKPFVTETYSLEDSAKAIKTLEDRKVLGKVVVNME